MLGNKGSKKFYRTGGTRGGQDQFKWEDVKSDKQRENYLGHSAMAPIGRWQKGKDILWYTKESSGSEKQALEDEREELRRKENELIDEALGIKSKRNKYVDNQLDSLELKQLLSRGATERASIDIERIQGLGAAPAKVHEHIERLSYVEKEIKQLKESNILKETGENSQNSEFKIPLNKNISININNIHSDTNNEKNNDSDEHNDKPKKKKHKKEKKGKKVKESKKERKRERET